MLLSLILHRQTFSVRKLVKCSSRNKNAFWFTQLLKPCGNVYAIANEILTIHYYVAKVHPNP